jgi:hypothetical protein
MGNKIYEEIDRLRAINKELLEACEYAIKTIINLAEVGIERIRDAGGQCDDAVDTYKILNKPLNDAIKKAKESCEQKTHS